MFEELEAELSFKLPTRAELNNPNFRKNFSFFLPDLYDDGVSTEPDPEYEQFLADVWVGIVLTLMVLCCVCCMCSCLLYHKFQQWKRTVEDRRRGNLEAGNSDCESLPSYTIVSGLPTYEEALEQLKKVKELVPAKSGEPPRPHVQTPPTQPLSVMELFQIYKNAPSDPSLSHKS